MQRGLRNRIVTLALMGPLLLFLLFFFAIPLFTMMKSAISDPVASQTLPQTVSAMAGWDRTNLPSATITTAFVADLRNINDDEVFGDLVRRLNSAKAGFRTLMAKTKRAAMKSDGELNLTSVDKRWGDVSFWQVVGSAAASPITDRNLLAAIDLKRDAMGHIEFISAERSANRATFIRTFWISAIVTAICVLIGLPFAMVAASVNGWKRQVLLGAVLLPLWTSLLVRTAAWFILLQNNGPINSVLMWLGVTHAPIPMIFNRFGVIIAMTHVLLPFMVLPIFSVLIGIPNNLMPAAASLGANPLRAFLKVLLPLSMRGVVSGSLLVFMTAIGYYITPELIGGAKDQMISSVIAYYAMGAANWGMAGALGLILLLATVILYTVYIRFSSEDEVRR